MRKTIVEASRARARWIHGFAMAELRDTPTSSAGLFDDWGTPRLTADEINAWNGQACLFPLPDRVVRASGMVTLDPFNHFAGEVRLALGLQTEREICGTLWWSIVDEAGRTVARGTGDERRIHGAVEIGAVEWTEAVPGTYRLEAGFGTAENAWDLWVVEQPNWRSIKGWRREDIDSDGIELSLSGGNRVVTFHHPVQAEEGILFLEAGDNGTENASFWEESALEFQNESFWAGMPFRERWSRLLPISPNAELNEDWLKDQFGSYEVLLNRIDTSPNGVLLEHPILVRAGRWFITTLRPEVERPIQYNPAGCVLIESLIKSLSATE